MSNKSAKAAQPPTGKPNGKDAPATGSNLFWVHDIQRTWAELQETEQTLKLTYAEWCDRVMAFAMALLAGRMTFRNAATGAEDDTAFGKWLDENNYGDITKDDRAAYLDIARHEELAKTIMADTKSHSVRMIALKIKQVIASLDKDKPNTPTSSKEEQTDDDGDPSHNGDGDELDSDDVDRITEGISEFAFNVTTFKPDIYVAQLDEEDRNELAPAIERLREFAGKLASATGADPDPLVDPISAIYSLGYLWSDVAAWDRFVQSLDANTRALLASVSAVEALADVATVLDDSEQATAA